jgi:lysozyme
VHTDAPPVSTQPAEIIDQALINFIKKEEGFRAKAYWDYKQYSIGYGTKANSATEVITEAEAEARLVVEVNKAWALVKPILPEGTPVGIQQALVDLTYNAGSGWETQSLGAAVKAAKWDTVKADILQYNHAGGQVNAGLTARREAEVSWFDSPL